MLKRLHKPRDWHGGSLAIFLVSMEGIQKIADRNKAVNLWTARVIPMVLAGVVGYATYVCIVLLCGK